jgi:hypothetical protein
MALEYTLSGEVTDTDHYLVLAQLGVSKQAVQKFVVEIFNLTKLGELEVKK